jgi:hypothetical protein
MIVRGPIGPQRNDFYTSFMARYSGSSYSPEAGIEILPMPWDESNPDKYRK